MNKLVIKQDSFYENPFTDWDCMPMLFSSHRDYNWGDQSVMAEGGYNSLTEEFEARVKDVAASIPVYLYRHSGDTVSSKPFSCPWDSGQLGYLYFTKEQAREMYSIKRISAKKKAQLEESLRRHVKLLDYYVTGQVYGFEVQDQDGEHIDSCWGFYGEDIEGIAEHLSQDDFPDQDLKKVVEEAFENIEY